MGFFLFFFLVPHHCVCVCDCENNGAERSLTHPADGGQMEPLKAEKQQQIVAAVVTWSHCTYGDGTKRLQSAIDNLEHKSLAALSSEI